MADTGGARHGDVVIVPDDSRHDTLHRGLWWSRSDYHEFIETKYKDLWKTQPLIALLDALARADEKMVNAMLSVLTVTHVREASRAYLFAHQIAYLDNVTILHRFLKFSPAMTSTLFVSTAYFGIETLSYFFANYKPSEFDTARLQLVYRGVLNRPNARMINEFKTWIGGRRISLPKRDVVAFTREGMREIVSTSNPFCAEHLYHALYRIALVAPATYLDARELFSYDTIRLLNNTQRVQLCTMYERPLLKEWLQHFAPHVLKLLSTDYTPVRVTMTLPSGQIAHFDYRRKEDGSASEVIDQITMGDSNIFKPV